MKVNIALLTVTDTRTLNKDKSGNILVTKIKKAQHNLVEREICKDSKKIHPRNLMGTDEKLKHHNKDTDKQTFLKSLFFVEKFAEKTNAKTFHAFANDVVDLDKAHHPTLNVLQDYTLRNCWPHWDKFTQRELHTEPNLARDGVHYGVEHHKRFAQLFLDRFATKLK